MRTNAEFRRARILEFIIDYKRGHDGCSPAIRQIGEHCAISSISVTLYHLRHLEASGKIRRGTDKINFNIEVIGGKWSYEEPTEYMITHDEHKTISISQRS